MRDAKGPSHVFVHTYDLNATLLSTVTSSIGFGEALHAGLEVRDWQLGRRPLP